MSMVAGKLLLVSLVPVVSAGVAYPLVAKLKRGETQIEKKVERQIELTKIQDFEKHCFVSLQGEENDESGFNKKLLACDLSEGVKFYFHNESEMKNALPKEVTEVTKKSEQIYSLTFVAETNQDITANNAAVWKDTFSQGIKVGCEIEHTGKDDVEDGGQERRKLKCGVHPSQRLEEFKITKR